MQNYRRFPDRQQNFWQLTSIQSAAQSVPGILVGAVLAQRYSPSIALTSMCIGNLILWLIGFGVISMAWKDRKNAIETVREYLGRGGAIVMALVLLCAFLALYMVEIEATVETLSPFFQIPAGSKSVIGGALLGVGIALLSMGGIRLIKWIAVISFPIILIVFTFCFFQAKGNLSVGPWDFSFKGILTVVAINLPGMVNLPTFFRHSHSRADSILALTLMTMFDALFQVFSVFIGISALAEIYTKFFPSAGISFALVMIIIAILLTTICLNLVNIYFASASLEEFIPSLVGPVGFLMIGLLGTGAYAFLQKSPPMLFLENIADNFIANLGVVLLISFLVSMIVKHRPRPFDKSISLLCWLIGSVIALVIQIFNPQDPIKALQGGVCGSILAYLIILFCEETAWSAQKL